MDDNEVMERAEKEGFRPYPCNACGGRGVRVTRDGSSSTGHKTEDPCGCGGWGVLWRYGGTLSFTFDMLKKRYSPQND